MFFSQFGRYKDPFKSIFDDPFDEGDDYYYNSPMTMLEAFPFRRRRRRRVRSPIRVMPFYEPDFGVEYVLPKSIRSKEKKKKKKRDQFSALSFDPFVFEESDVVKDSAPKWFKDYFAESTSKALENKVKKIAEKKEEEKKEGKIVDKQKKGSGDEKSKEKKEKDKIQKQRVVSYQKSYFSIGDRHESKEVYEDGEGRKEEICEYTLGDKSMRVINSTGKDKKSNNTNTELSNVGSKEEFEKLWNLKKKESAGGASLEMEKQEVEEKKVPKAEEVPKKEEGEVKIEEKKE